MCICDCVTNVGLFSVFAGTYQYTVSDEVEFGGEYFVKNLLTI